MIVFFSLFAIFSVIHLLFCFLEKEKLRKITKPFLLPILGIAMCFWVPQYPLIPIACFMSMIGDLFLIWNKKKYLFALGAFFFGVNHVLNMVTQSMTIINSRAPIYYAGIAIATLLVASLGFIHTSFDWMGIVKFGFSALHIVNIILAIIGLAMGYYLGSSLILCGYGLCVLSDLILERATFKKDFPRRDFYIMSTYLIGEVLTYCGLAFLVLV